MKLIVFFICILVFTTSCNRNKPSIKYELIKGTDSFVVGLNQPMFTYFHPSLTVFNQNDTSFMYYYCKADTTLRIISTKNIEDVKFISLSSIFNERIDYSNKEGVFSYMETQDLLWLDSPTSDSIYQVDLSSLNVVKSISKTLNNKDIFLSDFIQQHINSTKNELLLGIYYNTKGAFGLFEVQNNNTFLLKKELDTHPDDYKNKDMYLYSGVVTDISPDSFIISYYYSDTTSLFVKNKFVKQICLKSDSALEFTGFEGDRKDMNAITKFFAMKQRYDYLLYDNKNKIYYRAFSFEREGNIGKIEFSKKWSICIFDASFNKIHEEFFNDDDYFKGRVLLINSNLYLVNTKKSISNGSRDSSTFYFENFTMQQIQN